MTTTSMTVPTITTSANSNAIHFYHLLQYQTACVDIPVQSFPDSCLSVLGKVATDLLL